jgi:hypothetical protein
MGLYVSSRPRRPTKTGRYRTLPLFAVSSQANSTARVTRSPRSPLVLAPLASACSRTMGVLPGSAFDRATQTLVKMVRDAGRTTRMLCDLEAGDYRRRCLVLTMILDVLRELR